MCGSRKTRPQGSRARERRFPANIATVDLKHPGFRAVFFLVKRCFSAGGEKCEARARAAVVQILVIISANYIADCPTFDSVIVMPKCTTRGIPNRYCLARLQNTPVTKEIHRINRATGVRIYDHLRSALHCEGGSIGYFHGTIDSHLVPSRVSSITRSSQPCAHANKICDNIPCGAHRRRCRRCLYRGDRLS